MSPWTTLHPLRIGCVQYLNSRPLIHGYDGSVVYDHPSALAHLMANGELDAALVPIVEALRARTNPVVDGVAIGSAGPVFSVFIAHRCDVHAVRTVAIDPASVTSVHLMETLLRERGCDVHTVSVADPQIAMMNNEVDAVLLIGNQGIEFRQEHHAGFQFLDLGEEWQRQMNVPFVFAVWLLRSDIGDAQAVANAFRALQQHGASRLSEIVGGDPFRERYLTEHIRFQLGSREKLGIERFRALLVNYGLIPPSEEPLTYV